MQLRKTIFILCFFVFAINSNAQSDSIQEFEPLDPVQVSFMYGYYEQDGIHSPVTGGIGDEELTDNVGKITVNIPISKKVSFSFLAGMDYYTSASTDNINNEHDFYTETSASSADKRKYGDLGLQFENKKRRISYGLNVGFSEEWDVSSKNTGIYFAKESKNKNQQLKLSAFYYKDNWELIYPSEFRKLTIGGNELLSNNIRHLYDGAVTYAQIINKRMKAAITFEAVYQKGLLSTPFHRVYFTDTISHDIERLPDNRFKFPVGLHLNYFVNDFMIMRFYYRYYQDDFNIKAHTVDLELPIKVSRFFSVSPFYRFHTQNEAKYFAAFAEHDVNEVYYTSDYDLAAFSSHKYGIGIKYSPLFGVFKMKIPFTKGKKIKLKKIGVRAAKYYKMIEDKVVFKAFSLTGSLIFTIQ